jgi:putative ABC transport system permease protein
LRAIRTEKMTASVLLGLQALRLNPLRTLLSTLGVIMGVGALVSVLAMSDGVERFSREQMARSTDLLAVAIDPLTTRRVDGQVLPRPDTVRFSTADVDAVLRWPGVAAAEMMSVSAGLMQRHAGSQARGVQVLSALPTLGATRELKYEQGAFFTREDLDQARRVVVLSAALATAMGRPSVNDSIQLNGAWFVVRGVMQQRDSADAALLAMVPLGTAPVLAGSAPVVSPRLVVRARAIEDVAAIKQRAERWLEARLGRAWQERASVRANDERRAQMQQAMAVFKLLMAAITGVSLLVGGVGIMNVLLASVAERTREIGVRKAIGARQSDIRTQFLAESVAITSAGAALGIPGPARGPPQPN